MIELKKTNHSPKLLIVSSDIVGDKIAGPGMRYLEMARALVCDLDVTLAIPSRTNIKDSGVNLTSYDEDQPESLRKVVESNDIALISAAMVERFPFLHTTQTRLVVDLYAPFMLENLHYYTNESLQIQADFNRRDIEITNRLAQTGDFFICGSERQRDFWIGYLAANGRVNPQTFHQDPDLRALIDVVSIGFPEREPSHHPILRGVHPAFPDDSRIVLWGGGIWDWLDPLTLVRAWPMVINKHPQTKLVFLGMRHPNPEIPPHKMANLTVVLAEEIGEKDKSIFFYDWLSYEEREALLCEADIGVTLHPLHIETRYSIRTRILDYLWARLPVLVSEGDITNDWIREYGLGYVVPQFDIPEVVKGLNELLSQPKDKWAQAFEPLRQTFSWPRVVEPLRKYCLNGHYAPDREVRSPRPSSGGLLNTARRLVTRALYIRRVEGPRVLIYRIWKYGKWLLARQKHPRK